MESQKRATSPSFSRFHFRYRVIASYSQEFNFARFSLADRVKGGKSTGDHPVQFSAIRSWTAGRLSCGRGGERRGAGVSIDRN
ncbi:hypothetical protein WN51_10305 [Melipona quadrifasciata]|uniref:Uncharacterized protein n=1 Tax=Melipona quadrifasciata TaxID=166423 RepID=A0A0M9A4R8_9HYME|nr:hypothetical protein WN51_10305 [Melipona quadrifasciata]